MRDSTSKNKIYKLKRDCRVGLWSWIFGPCPGSAEGRARPNQMQMKRRLMRRVENGDDPIFELDVWKALYCRKSRLQNLKKEAELRLSHHLHPLD